MKKQVVVLGGGMIGAAMAGDLAKTDGFLVTVADARAGVLESIKARWGVNTVCCDLSSVDSVRKVIAEADFVVGALASVLGLRTLQTVIEAGKPYCDISFMAEDATQFDELARKKGVTAVVDCGVAPGVSNLLAGYGASQLDECERIQIYVGGLPIERRWPFEYKAGFAPYDVIEEYTRPSRIVENGRIVVRPALSEPELLDFPGVGTLEAFNTDGLRSIAYSLKVPFMVEKTLRYPGHIELMRVFREVGLFSKEPVEVAGQKVKPLDLMSALLFPKWTFAEGEADLTVLRVVAEGKKNGQATRLTWDLFDRYDPATKTRSMSRTTGYAATSMVALIARGVLKKPGVFPPERLAGEPGLVDQFLAEYARRGVQVTASVNRPTA